MNTIDAFMRIVRGAKRRIIDLEFAHLPDLIAAIANARSHARLSGKAIRKVVHVSPSFFDPTSYIGGGERYVTDLAAAMANIVSTRLVTFGPRRSTIRRNQLTIDVYPVDRFINGNTWDPQALRFLWGLRNADVVHCYQHKTFVTTMAILSAAILCKPCFVTDLGGQGWLPPKEFRVDRFVSKFCEISAFSVRPELTRRSAVIHGGVNQHFLDNCPAPWPRPRRVLFVGRLLPHKGIDVLIKAVDADTELVIAGWAHHEGYYALLRTLAVGKQVRFMTNVTDKELMSAYQAATVTVLPSVYVDCYGRKHNRPELLGLVLLESMALGTPVICTAVGGMPEYVEDGVTGFIVSPNSPEQLRTRIQTLLGNVTLAQQMGKAGRQVVLERFTWEHVARRCLDVYGRGERRC